MPGTYEDTGGEPRHATLLTPLNGTGRPLQVPNVDNFVNIPMDAQAGGAIGPIPGLRTGQRTDCIVVAVMQHDGQGHWERYYFAHLRGGQWTATNQQLFNQSITAPARSYIAMNSNAFAGMTILLEQMNEGNPNGDIPLANLLQYKSLNPTFAMRLADSSIGQVP